MILTHPHILTHQFSGSRTLYRCILHLGGGGDQLYALTWHTLLLDKNLEKGNHVTSVWPVIGRCTHLGMLGSQFVQDVGGIESGVITELARNDLKGFGIRTDEQLLLAGDCPGVISQVLGQLHLNGSAAGNNRVILEETKK